MMKLVWCMETVVEYKILEMKDHILEYFFFGWLELFLWYEIYSLILDSQVIKSEQVGSNFKIYVIFKY